MATDPATRGPQIAWVILVAAVSWQIWVLIAAAQPRVFAVLAPLLCLRDDAFSVFNLSIARLVGMVAGLLIAIALLQLLQPDRLAIAVVLALALLAGWPNTPRISPRSWQLTVDIHRLALIPHRNPPHGRSGGADRSPCGRCTLWSRLPG